MATAVTLYKNARMDGLCHDGAWECALTAVASTNPEAKAQWVSQLKQRLQESLLC